MDIRKVLRVPAAVHAVDLKLDAFETLIRYVQPLPDGYFCREPIRAALLVLVPEMPATMHDTYWRETRRRLPACDPPGCLAVNED